MSNKSTFTAVCVIVAVTALITTIGVGMVRAGSLAPSAAPAATSYTLSDIFTRLATNAAATAGNHSFTPTTTPQSIFHTLTDIYDAIPTMYASDFLASSTYLGVTGTIAVKSGDAGVASSSTTTNKLMLTPVVGYYDGANASISTTSDNFVSTNIKSGVYLFGVTGDSNVVDSSSGDAVASDIASGKIAWVDGAEVTGTATSIDYSLQSLQTKDDWVNSGGTTGEYTAEEAGTWSAVDGSPFATAAISYNPVGSALTLASGVVEQDPRTGVWWSDVMAIGTTATSTTNEFDPATDGTRPTGGNAIGFCNALNTANFGGHNDWYLPTQKQLMQAYIDGAANNLPNPGNYFWSSTEGYSGSANAWRVYLYYGYTTYNAKTTSSDVRCVRP